MRELILNDFFSKLAEILLCIWKKRFVALKTAAFHNYIYWPYFESTAGLRRQASTENKPFALLKVFSPER